MNRGRRLILTRTAMVLAGALALSVPPLRSAVADSGPGAAQGRVTDTDGNPLPGIVVSFQLAGQVVRQDETDATGTYEVGQLPPDPHYYVEFRDPAGDFATEWYFDRNPADWTYQFVPIAPDETTTLVDTEMEDAATITGRLSSGAGEPVAGAAVTLWLLRGGSVSSTRTAQTTDATGRYAIGRLKAATYLVGFYDPATGIQEYWDNASNLLGGTAIVLSAGTSVTADAVLGGTITNTQPPTISGPAEVGQPLTASPGAWTPAGIALTYRWVVGVDSDPTDDPTGAVYVPSVADLGKTVRVHVTGTALGWLPGTALSAPSDPVVVPAVVNAVRPRITGVARVGRIVRVSRGEWEPAEVRRSYQWFVAGRRVRDATTRRLVLRSAHLGKQVKVRVRATAVDHRPAIVWTRGVRVRR
jgi:hypothetical protein